MFINTGPRADYPAPARAYAKARFAVVERGRHYRRAGADRLAVA